MAIHIGKIIKSTIKAKGIDVTVLAEKIGYTRGNIYKILGKPSIDTDLLAKIGKHMGVNFFLHYMSNEEMEDHIMTAGASKESNMKQLKKILNFIEKEVESKKKAAPKAKKASKK